MNPKQRRQAAKEGNARQATGGGAEPLSLEQSFQAAPRHSQQSRRIYGYVDQCLGPFMTRSGHRAP